MMAWLLAASLCGSAVGSPLETHWPSTDPTNRAGWVPYPPMTDEFTEDQLNESKWTTNAQWKGVHLASRISSPTPGRPPR